MENLNSFLKFKKRLKRVFRRFGYDVIRYLPECSDRARLLKLLKVNKIDMIFDVGANIGNYADMLFEIGYCGNVISFEPLTSAYVQLLAASRKNPKWIIAERCAIGDKTGEIEINISKNSQSSSVLPILDAHIETEPDSAYIGSEKVKIYRLDEIAAGYASQSEALFLKMDVQGFEDKVLDGASGLLSEVRGIQLELTLVPLYRGQILFEEMLGRLRSMGYELYNLSSVFTGTSTGKMLQMDGIFFKKE
jgi:FkbM family methyltransferase